MSCYYYYCCRSCPCCRHRCRQSKRRQPPLTHPRLRPAGGSSIGLATSASSYPLIAPFNARDTTVAPGSAMDGGPLTLVRQRLRQEGLHVSRVLLGLLE